MVQYPSKNPEKINCKSDPSPKCSTILLAVCFNLKNLLEYVTAPCDAMEAIGVHVNKNQLR